MSVYLSAEDGVYAAPVGGGEAKKLAMGAGSPRGIVVRGGSVYWVQSDDCKLQRLALNAGTPGTLYAGNFGTGTCLDLAVDDSHVYFVIALGPESKLARVPIAGGNLELLATVDSRVVAVSDDGVFFGQNGSLVRMDK